MLQVNRVAGGGKNVTLHVSGLLTEDIDFTPIDTGLRERLKLTSLVWLVQEKLGLHLWWNKEFLLLPMESRNAVRFDTGLMAPKDWDGKMLITSYNFSIEPRYEYKSFFFILDFDR